ncbi:MAG: hypothetical protein IKS06_02825, partial [Lachnospiraceae bacterium]|nr:hypothetical protein [Lachnospiraceae bacterium]
MPARFRRSSTCSISLRLAPLSANLLRPVKPCSSIPRCALHLARLIAGSPLKQTKLNSHAS